MLKKLCLFSTLFLCTSALSLPLTVEEQRIGKVDALHPEISIVFSEEVARFNKQWQSLSSYQAAEDLVSTYAESLWDNAKHKISISKQKDDRPLYWARLKSSKIIKANNTQLTLTDTQQNALISLLEQGSRGKADLRFTQKTMKKIVLTGFDPFLLDRNINQSNPSGIAALMLDGKVIRYKGITAEINTVMVPVVYKDFDDGIIESLLTPYYTQNNVDMVVTVSMGRSDFDLERFPGKRRSVTAPDNVNVEAGGTQKKPIIPSLHNLPLSGSEFVEFSLPVEAMQRAKGPYKIIDNHKVTSLSKGEHAPKTLNDLKNEIAINGSGGGYLSNEISYRSIRLRNELHSTIPTGHIHTPRIKQFDPAVEEAIVVQIQAMLEQALVAI